MTAVLWLLVGGVCWLAIAAPVAVLVGKAIDPGEAGPDGSAGDLLADLPVDCLGPDEVDHEFFALVDPIEAEIDRRWTR